MLFEESVLTYQSPEKLTAARRQVFDFASPGHDADTVKIGGGNDYLQLAEVEVFGTCCAAGEILCDGMCVDDGESYYPRPSTCSFPESHSSFVFFRQHSSWITTNTVEAAEPFVILV